MKLFAQFFVVFAYALELVLEGIFDPRKLETLHQHVTFGLLGRSFRGACHLLVDPVIELELLQRILEPFTDDLRKTIVDHGT